jgi:hypothetical protein
MKFSNYYFGIYYKRFFFAFLFVVVGLITSFVVYRAQARTITVYDPKPLNTIVYPPAEMTKNDPALHSLAAMYAPMDTQENWIKSVCVGMTAGGCDYFKTHQAAAVWDEQLGNIGSSAGYISKTTVMDETHEVWTAAISIFTKGPNDKHSTEHAFDVYVLVERGADQKWYLDRVLIGPSIDLETVD